LEFSLREFSQFETSNIDFELFKPIKTMEILQTLKRDDEGIAAIGRIELKNEVSDIEDYVKLFFSGGNAEVQLLYRDNGAYIVFVKHNWTSPPFTKGILKAGGYIISREINEGRMRLTLLGSVKQLKCALENLKKTRMRFRVVSLTDARFSSDSPLYALTEKQRRVLAMAYRLGYYNLPRTIDSEQLAKKLRLKPATLVVHRRRAEHRLLEAIYSGKA
jgi:DNA-binding CsgD family transcriptional regulator